MGRVAWCTGIPYLASGLFSFSLTVLSDSILFDSVTSADSWIPCFRHFTYDYGCFWRSPQWLEGSGRVGSTDGRTSRCIVPASTCFRLWPTLHRLALPDGCTWKSTQIDISCRMNEYSHGIMNTWFGGNVAMVPQVLRRPVLLLGHVGQVLLSVVACSSDCRDCRATSVPMALSCSRQTAVRQLQAFPAVCTCLY
jgi:hypothetical protein